MNSPATLVSVYSLFALIGLSECYNILVIFDHPGKSHFEVFRPLFQELGERGHNLTIISHVKPQGDIKNAKNIPLSSDVAITDLVDLSHYDGSYSQSYWGLVGYSHYVHHFADTLTTCEPGLQNEAFQRFLREDHHFDVILVEFFHTNCLYGLITKYKAPFIGLNSSPILAWIPQWFGSPDNPSYMYSVYVAKVSPMKFLERVENTIMHYGHILWYKFLLQRAGKEVAKKYIGYEPADPHTASLFLSDTHYSLHGVRPMTPAMVEVGGIHVSNKKPGKLPEDIERWTNGSAAGLIYFSLGSVIKANTFPKNKLRIFTKIFSKLPQRVLWKYDGHMEDKPDNVMLIDWAPQFDILCHPNTKLFIAHGGLLGTTEAVHCGVPMVVMPQFADQPLNAKLLEKSGAGVELTLGDATEETVTKALEKALSPETRAKAKYLSERFRDRPATPLDTAVYWVEHIARHKGGQHMRSEAIDMPFYQVLLLDVLAFLAVVSLLIIFTTYKSTKFLLGLVSRSKSKIKMS